MRYDSLPKVFQRNRYEYVESEGFELGTLVRGTDWLAEQVLPWERPVVWDESSEEPVELPKLVQELWVVCRHPAGRPECPASLQRRIVGWADLAPDAPQVGSGPRRQRYVRRI